MSKAETFEENYKSLSKHFSLMREEKTRLEEALKIATKFIKGISQIVINDCDNQYVVLGNFKKFAQDTLNQINEIKGGK